MYFVACNCNPVGTELKDPLSNILVCNYATGQCPCKSHVEGKHCDICAEGYWNIASGNGCEPCNCDPIGSLDGTCDISSGQCHCRRGVTGQKCDQCMPLQYGFSVDGCKGTTSFEYTFNLYVLKYIFLCILKLN